MMSLTSFSLPLLASIISVEGRKIKEILKVFYYKDEELYLKKMHQFSDTLHEASLIQYITGMVHLTNMLILNIKGIIRPFELK